MGLISWIAAITQVHYILFPELGALSHDVIKRPHGTWAKAPGMLVLTPLATGLVGTLLVRSMGNGVVPILLATAAAMLIIRVSEHWALTTLFLMWRGLRRTQRSLS